VFDPELHEAVMHVEDESLGESIITDVFQKGYRLGDKVVRHSVVKVVN
jgi:molecular chaperone GrpE